MDPRDTDPTLPSTDPIEVSRESGSTTEEKHKRMRAWACDLYQGQSESERRRLDARVLATVPAAAMSVRQLADRLDEAPDLLWGCCESLAERLALRRGILLVEPAYACNKNSARALAALKADEQAAQKAQSVADKATDKERTLRAALLWHMPGTLVEIVRRSRRTAQVVSECLERMLQAGEVKNENGRWGKL